MHGQDGAATSGRAPPVLRAVALAAGLSLVAQPAAAQDMLRLLPQPTVAPGVAAFPRLSSDAPQAGRINQALAAADARARGAARACREEAAGSPRGAAAGGRQVQGWTRRITVAMRGPRYLALVTDDDADCGGLYPNAGRVALVYDLRTGNPPDWSRLLPRSLAGTASVETAMDGTPMGMVGSDALKSLYLMAARAAAVKVDPGCEEALQQLAGPFTLWPDMGRGGKPGGLVLLPGPLPHASAACGVPALIAVATLRQLGVQPGLLDAIDAARRASR